jgi:hypothetical protein
VIRVSTRASKKEESEYRSYAKQEKEQQIAPTPTPTPTPKRAKVLHPCPNHPDVELKTTGGANYIMGENNPKKKEVSGVGFCSACGFHVSFTYQKKG